MRRFLLRTSAAVILLLTLFIVSAYAEEAVITGNDVNFRSGPGMNYEVTDCLEKGTEVTVNDRSDSYWYSVTYNGKTGFVYSAYLSITEAEVTEEVEVVSEETSAAASFINAMYVRFRSGPSTGYSILGELNTGTPVTVLGSSGSWSLVSVNGQEGYVFSDYITTAGVRATDTVEADSEESQTADVPDDNEDSEESVAAILIESPAEAQTPVESPVIEVAALDEYEGYINGDYVRFRTGPGTTYSIISSYNRNQSVTVKGSSGDWYLAVINGQEGYVYSSYVTVKETSAQSSSGDSADTAAAQVTQTESKTGYIKGTTVRFRAGASLNSNIIGEYNTGTEVTITGTSGDWTQVTIDGKSGYVYSAYVTETAPAVSVQGSTEGQKIANYAMQFLGCDYVWGGNSPEEGFDCSGLVHYVYGQFGYDIHRVACDIAGDGVHVEPDDLQPGDVLCFYSSDNYIGHVGIYIGNGQFIHASTYTTGVIISELDTSYYANNFEARRIVTG